MRLNHSSCLKSVIDLHDISFNEQQTNERLSHFDELKEEILVIEESVTENIKTVDDLKETYMNAIKAYRKRLDDMLNMLQSKIESAGKSKCDANVERLQNIADKCKDTYARIDQKRKLIEELLRNNHERNLFIISKGLDKEITEIKEVVRQAKLDNHVVQFGFVENSSLDRTLLNDIHEFGTLQETCDGSEMEPETTLEVENNVQESFITDDSNPGPSSCVQSFECRPVKGLSVLRFKNRGNGWGYRMDRNDAIAFEVEENIVLTHVYIYGNCNENGKMEVSLSLVKGNQPEPLSMSKVQLLCEVTHSTEWYEVEVENGGSSYGIKINAGAVYHIVVKIKGKNSYYGRHGYTNVISDGTTFIFSNSYLSTNKKNVGTGQIAGL